MQVIVYGSLDRSVSYFGIKGAYAKPALIGGGSSLVLGFGIGMLTSGIVGLIIFCLGFVGTYMGIMLIQSTMPDRDLKRRIAMSKCPSWVRVRPAKVEISHSLTAPAVRERIPIY